MLNVPSLPLAYCISFSVGQVLTWSTNIYLSLYVGRSEEIIRRLAMNQDLKECK